MWELTPRQITGFIQLLYRRELAERSAELGITALGAQGKDTSINKQIEEWEAES